MPPRHPLYVAWIAEPVPEAVPRPAAPLHLTLVPPFAGDEDAVAEAMHAVATTSAPVTSAVTGRARFGPRGDVPVLLVAPDTGLRALHDLCMTEMQERGIDLSHARHVRDAYKPHVSVRRPHPDGPEPGDLLRIDHVALLRRGAGGTVVVGRAPLAGPG
ncbi:MAG: 2'-5' RNA ligase family protein [Thermoleophilia bacterium]